jgi:hypothetical protein
MNMDREIDYLNPEEVVSNFIVAMNEWEIEANHLSKSGKGFDAIIESMNKVFDLFCTKKDRPYGRNGSFQRPPEYDPKSESIVFSNVEESNKATVITSREATLGGGIYKYVLYKKSGKWLIDNLKFEEKKGKFTNALL